jgi:hypothetical protein
MVRYEKKIGISITQGNELRLRQKLAKHKKEHWNAQLCSIWINQFGLIQRHFQAYNVNSF